MAEHYWWSTFIFVSRQGQPAAVFGLDPVQLRFRCCKQDIEKAEEEQHHYFFSGEIWSAMASRATPMGTLWVSICTWVKSTGSKRLTPIRIKVRFGN